MAYRRRCKSGKTAALGAARIGKYVYIIEEKHRSGFPMGERRGVIYVSKKVADEALKLCFGNQAERARIEGRYFAVARIETTVAIERARRGELPAKVNVTPDCP